MSKPAIPFPNNTNVPVIGQPFTMQSVYLPVCATLTCNCGGDDTTVKIENSAGGACQSCGRVFNAAFNPQTGQLAFQIQTPKTEGVPS